ncbi:MAG TPA: hypothetical protein VE871_18370 [Longimicrobium sp.]|nr:hypothetical protein [Longimicrobium sp.]
MSSTDVIIRMLGAGEAAMLDRVAPDVFDHDVDPLDGGVLRRSAAPPGGRDR